MHIVQTLYHGLTDFTRYVVGYIIVWFSEIMNCRSWVPIDEKLIAGLNFSNTDLKKNDIYILHIFIRPGKFSRVDVYLWQMITVYGLSCLFRIIYVIILITCATRCSRSTFAVRCQDGKGWKTALPLGWRRSWSSTVHISGLGAPILWSCNKIFDLYNTVLNISNCLLTLWADVGTITLVNNSPHERPDALGRCFVLLSKF